MKKLTFLLFGLFLIFTDANASHLYGGEISWECSGNNAKYRFTVRLYRDCGYPSGPSHPPSISLTGGPVTILCNPTQTVTFIAGCDTVTGSGLQCGVDSLVHGAVEMKIYRSNWVTINGPIPITGYQLRWASCCRPKDLTNRLIGSGFAIRAFLLPYKNTSSCFNNSPVFMETPLVLACSGTPVVYNNKSVDEDGDSLYFEWTDPLQSNLMPITFINGYSASNPLPDSKPPFNPNNKGITLNKVSGQINFTCFDNGMYITAIKAIEYRKGVKISETTRDFPIIVKSCTPDTGNCFQPQNNAPSLSLGVDSTSFPNGSWLTPVYNSNNDLVYYKTSVSAKDELNVNIYSTDKDSLGNCTQQTIRFFAEGNNLANDSLWSDSSSCSVNAPCATLQSLNPGGGFTNVLNNNVAFKWKTDCPNISYRKFARQEKSTSYLFYFNVKDNACPINGENYTTLKVQVLNHLPKPPILLGCLNYIASKGNLSFSWLPPVDTNINFDYYIVYHSTNKNGPYSIIDTITNYTDTNFVDYGRGSGTHYYFVRTAGGCNILSETSDTISLMDLLVTPLPATNPTQAQLNWTAHSSNPNSGVFYQIWKRILPAGSWNKIDSTQVLTYTDNLNGVLISDVEYQIGINGGCLSYRVYIGIEENLLSNIKVSPNPFNERIIVNVPTEINANALTLKLFGVGGKEINDLSLIIRDNEIEINNVASLPRGVYFLQISTSKNTHSIKLLH